MRARVSYEERARLEAKERARKLQERASELINRLEPITRYYGLACHAIVLNETHPFRVRVMRNDGASAEVVVAFPRVHVMLDTGATTILTSLADDGFYQKSVPEKLCGVPKRVRPLWPAKPASVERFRNGY